MTAGWKLLNYYSSDVASCIQLRQCVERVPSVDLINCMDFKELQHVKYLQKLYVKFARILDTAM
jgi:putative IMPACT (imprinted ancient) family translation regulator